MRNRILSELEPSDASWLGSVPRAWEQKKLKYAVQIRDVRIDGDVARDPYVGLEHIESWTGTLKVASDSSSTGIVNCYRAGDVLLGKLRPYLAKVHAAQRDGVCTTEALVLSVLPGLEPRYLFYFLANPAAIDNINSSTYGAKMPRANWEFVGDQVQLLPSVEEQMDIVTFLDHETARIDALIDKKRRLSALLEEKRLAVITHAVTKGLDSSVEMKDSGIDWLGEIPAHWEVKRQKFISAKITVGIVVTPAAYYADEGIPTLRGFNVKERKLDLNDLVFISNEANEMHAKSKIYAGDLVAVRTGLPGTTAVVPAELDGANCVDLIIIRRSATIDPEFAAYFANSDAAKAQYRAGSEGALQQHFNIDTAKNLIVAVPPLDEQGAILTHLRAEESKLLKAIATLSRSVATLMEYRSALITNAVTGKIDVRGEMANEAAA